MFSNKEREDLIKKAIDDFKNEVRVNSAATPAEKRAVERLDNGNSELIVESYEGKTVDFAIKHKAHHLVRGMRDNTDYEQEQTLADANAKLSEAREFYVGTLLIPTAPQYIFTSSAVIRTLADEPRAISSYLYPSTADAVAEKVAIQARIGKRAGASKDA